MLDLWMLRPVNRGSYFSHGQPSMLYSHDTCQTPARLSLPLLWICSPSYCEVACLNGPQGWLCSAWQCWSDETFALANLLLGLLRNHPVSLIYLLMCRLDIVCRYLVVAAGKPKDIPRMGSLFCSIHATCTTHQHISPWCALLVYHAGRSHR